MKTNRRNFLKTIGVGFGALALPNRGNFLNRITPAKLGRVTAKSLSVYSEPSDQSSILFQRYRDEILHIYYTIESEDGPGYNPFWHRVWGGYMHSAFVQDVRNQLNPVMTSFPSSGQLMELSVPYSQSYVKMKSGLWETFYKLYYSSTHYVFETFEGPDGEPWYRVDNALLTLSYYVRATHLRKVTDKELLPIHPEVDPKEKRIEISIDFQTIKAYEGDHMVKEALVSTGLPTRLTDPALIPTDTPKGNHIIQNKRPSVHMGDGTLRSDAEAYELPGVPWVSYFDPTKGVAIHGTYWHNNFGVTMSHGCINMRSEDAKWIYRWCTTYSPKSDNNTYRTPVLVY